MLKNMLGSNYFSRLWLYSLFIVVFPVLVLGGYSYFKASGIALQKVNDGNEQITLQTQLRVEQVLKAIDAAAGQLISSPIINNSLNQELSFREFQLIRQLFEYTQRIQSYELGIQDVQLINTEKNWLLENSGMYPINEYQGAMDIAEFNRNPSHSVWITRQTGVYPSSTSVLQADASANVRLVRKLPLNVSKPSFYMVTKIAMSEITKLVERNPGMGAILILDADSGVLADPDGLFSGVNSVSSAEIRNRIGEEQLNQFQVDYKGQEVSVTYRRSSYNGWIYMTLVPIQEVTKESRAIGWITFYICGSVMAVLLLLSFLHTRKMYNPVRKLYESVMRITDSTNDLKNQDEFQFIGERFQMLSVSQLKLEHQMQGHMQQLKEYFVLKLFQGEMKQADIKERLRDYPFAAVWTTKTVLVTQIDSIEGTRYREADKDLLLFAINNMISELIAVDNRLSPILIHPSQVTLVGSDIEEQDEWKNQLYQMAEKIQRAVQQYLDLKISIGVSRSYSGWGDLNKAYQEGLEALKYRIKLGQESIIFIEDQQPVISMKLIYPEMVKNDLMDAIKLLEIDRINQHMRLFIKEVVAKDCAHHEYQFSFMRLLLELIELSQQLGVSWEEVNDHKGSLFDQLLELNSSVEIEQWFLSTIIEPIMEAVLRSRALYDTSISDEVLKMIHDEYSNELTLELCAARLHYHPSHVKRVFRRDVGMSFSDYVSTYRLQVAKKWLTQTQLKVNDIAEKLCYTNAQNFIRYFRKVEGMTPGQYRDLHKEWE
jgi:two-component system response regulator YesN